MGSGIYTALSGAVAQSQALDVTANNIANASSTAFRAERVRFAEVLGKAKGKLKDQSFVAVGGTAPDTSPGALNPTGRALDIGLQGDGFFAVDAKAGVRWSRAGELSLDPKGVLTQSGLPLRTIAGKHIVVPPNVGDVNIASDGTVSAGGNALGKLQLARFDAKQIKPEGNTLWVTTPNAQPVAGTPTVAQGVLEQSNFNIVRGMVDLVRVSRTYEATHQLIQTYHDIDDRTARAGNG